MQKVYIMPNFSTFTYLLLFEKTCKYPDRTAKFNRNLNVNDYLDQHAFYLFR